MFINLNKIDKRDVVYMLKDSFYSYELLCFISGYQNPAKVGEITIHKDTDIQALEDILNANL